jgi:hypothetical protein
MREGEGERKWMGVYRSERLGMREIWNEIRRGREGVRGSGWELMRVRESERE